MKTNVEIIRETIEQIVNQKKINKWDHYFDSEYIARGAPFIGMGFSRDTSENKHIIAMVIPGSPVDGKLQVGDELLWVEDEHQRWSTFDEIEQGSQGTKYKVGIHRGNETIEYDLDRGFIEGFDTPTNQARSEMQEFMMNDIPNLKAVIKLILSDGDMVVCLLEYRGTHARFKREAVWREAWFTRLADGKIVESWPIMDETSFLRHLGYQFIPPSE